MVACQGFLVQVERDLNRKAKRRVRPKATRACVVENLTFLSESLGLRANVRRSSTVNTVGLVRISVNDARVRRQQRSSAVSYEGTALMRVRIFRRVNVRAKRGPRHVVHVVGQDAVGRGGVLVTVTTVRVRSTYRLLSFYRAARALRNLRRVQ